MIRIPDLTSGEMRTRVAELPLSCRAPRLTAQGAFRPARNDRIAKDEDPWARHVCAAAATALAALAAISQSMDQDLIFRKSTTFAGVCEPSLRAVSREDDLILHDPCGETAIARLWIPSLDRGRDQIVGCRGRSTGAQQSSPAATSTLKKIPMTHPSSVAPATT